MLAEKPALTRFDSLNTSLSYNGISLNLSDYQYSFTFGFNNYLSYLATRLVYFCFYFRPQPAQFITPLRYTLVAYVLALRFVIVNSKTTSRSFARHLTDINGSRELQLQQCWVSGRVMMSRSHAHCGSQINIQVRSFKCQCDSCSQVTTQTHHITSHSKSFTCKQCATFISPFC